MASKVVLDFIKMALFKKGGAIANDKAVQFSADALEKRLMNLGIDSRTLNNQTELKQVLAYVKQMEDEAFNQQFSGIMKNKNFFKKEGDVIPFKQKRSFAEEIEAMKKSGDIVDVEDVKISEKITDRDMFKNSNLNKTDVEGIIKNIKKLSPMDAMKEANLVIGRKNYYKNLTPEESKKILQDTEDHIFERDIIPDPEDMAKGGRAGFYTGGITDVEPSLDDIGHGSDALNARTRLLSPGAQATTSTGLNYLLADDNDNMRIPFGNGYGVKDHQAYVKEVESELHAHFKKYKKMGGKMKFNQYAPKFRKENYAEGGRIGFQGGGMSKRAFLKLLATLGGGVAAAKTGILGLGKGTGKQVTKEVVKAAGSGTPPPYFFKLVEKIQKLGDETLATKDKAIAKKYKDYTMEEDFAGNIEIIKKGDDVAEDVFMSYKVDDVPVKGKKGSTKVEEYEEYTAKPDAEGKMKDIEQGVPDSVVMEVEAGSGNVPESFYTGINAIKKADGGRIGFSVGSLAKLGITGTSRRFLEKIFGKEGLETMIKRDPEMHRGLLEVTEMFRKRDKEGLKSYMKNFLPHMDDTEIEEFIVGDAVDAAGQAKFGLGDMQGQLIRLGSGRDYKAKIEAIKKLEDAQKLDTLDVTEEMIRKPNAFGGIQTMLGE